MKKITFQPHPSFKNLALGSIFGVAVVVAVTAPKLSNYFANKGVSLIKVGDGVAQQNPRLAIVNYRLASLVRPGDRSLQKKLVALYLSQNRPNDALGVLKRQPIEEAGIEMTQIQLQSYQPTEASKTIDKLLKQKESAAAYQQKSLVMIELNKSGEAVDTAKQAASFGLQEAALQSQLALAYLVAGETEKFHSVIAKLAEEAALKLKAASTNRLALAKILYSFGLLAAAERALNESEKQSQNSETYLLLAQINLKKPKRLGLDQAKAYAQKGLTVDPSNLQLHHLAKSIYVDLGNQSAVDREIRLIKRLSEGKP